MLKRLPEKIRFLREQNGLSQKQLALQLGIAKAYIGHFENGRRKPSTELILKIANIFGISTDVLIRDELDLDDNER
jgi:transcriptional regulator with XRE-family HTH domain